MNSLTQDYLTYSGLIFNGLAATLIIIEGVRLAWKAYYQARSEIIEVIMKYERLEMERNFDKVKNI